MKTIEEIDELITQLISVIPTNMTKKEKSKYSKEFKRLKFLRSCRLLIEVGITKESLTKQKNALVNLIVAIDNSVPENADRKERMRIRRINGASKLNEQIGNINFLLK